MTTVDPYRPLAERLGYPNSLLFRRILEYLMTPQQARLAAELGLDIDS